MNFFTVKYFAAAESGIKNAAAELRHEIFRECPISEENAVPDKDQSPPVKEKYFFLTCIAVSVSYREQCLEKKITSVSRAEDVPLWDVLR